MIRVLLGHRDNLVGGALAAVVSAERDLRVVAQLTNGDEVTATVGRERPEVAVLDAGLPGSATVGHLCHALHGELPSCRPLVLVHCGANPTLTRSLGTLAPWLGLLTTDTTPARLVAAVRRLASGGSVLDPQLAESAQTARPNPLTTRERDILRLTRYGAPPKEIATKLDLSVGTVRNHLCRALTKTGARTRLGATQRAQEAGWI